MLTPPVFDPQAVSALAATAAPERVNSDRLESFMGIAYGGKQLKFHSIRRARTSRNGVNPRRSAATVAVMASAPPPGSPAPLDGGLPSHALATLPARGLSVYVHVPFCATRCGYCDFNTYTASELGGLGAVDYLTSAHAEMELAGRVLGAAAPPVQTVFVGGGTPTLLDARQLGGLVAAVADTFGLAPDAEITTEANPETITPELLDGLLVAGFTRLSMGMQSGVPSVLRVLDRVHTPGGAIRAVEMAQAAGFTDINLDLIYGTPGESLDDWHTTLTTALAARPTHVSAYALIVEDGTRLAARIRHGELGMTDDDDLADKYLMAEEALTGAGFHAYEISNWALEQGYQCRHNLAYWRSDNWWGIGPGAHSHIGGVRWWNLRHPRTYGSALTSKSSPAEAREVLDPTTRHVERVLLELRLAEGLPCAALTASEQGRLPALMNSGLLVLDGDRIRLTLRGRLLADGITRDLLD